jgi:hypothetical protein
MKVIITEYQKICNRLLLSQCSHVAPDLCHSIAQFLGKATPLDIAANLTRTRHKSGDAPVSEAVKTGTNLIKIAFQQYHENRED